jgi:hypothetical protein
MLSSAYDTSGLSREGPSNDMWCLVIGSFFVGSPSEGQIT